MAREVLSLFKAKHFPPEFLNLVSLTELERISPTMDLSRYWAIIETAKETVSAEQINQLSPGTIIVYPGRHPEQKHNLATLADREIRLFKLENSPWNDAVGEFILKQRQILLGAQTPPPETIGLRDFSPIPELIHQKEHYGILGVGDIGAQVVKTLRLRSEAVSYAARTSKPEIEALGVDRLSLEELFATCDVVVISLPLSTETYHLVDSRLLKLLKNSATLISTSAGGVINESDLLAAMLSSQIRVALDTFEDEANFETHSVFNPNLNPIVLTLIKSGRLLLTPHIAYKNAESTQKLISVLSLPLLEIIRSGNIEKAYEVDPINKHIARPTSKTHHQIYRLKQAS